MPLSSDSYGSVDGVHAYVGYMTFDAPNYPTTEQVETWINEQSARLNAWLARNGYSIPITSAVSTRAVTILAMYANQGAAGLAELSMRSAGYSATDEDKRENRLLAEFAKAEAFIASGALGALGVGIVRAQAPFYGLSSGGRTATGQSLRPIFTRTSFGNRPTRETGEPESGY